MIDLYGMSSPNVFKVSIMLEEVGLPWRGHHVDVFKGEQFTAEFLAKSPNNKVPVLVDSEGPKGASFSVFESGAILIYLAEKTGKLLARDPAERSVQLQWLMMQMSTVGPMFGQLNHFLRYAPEGNAYSQARYTSEMRRILGVLQARLAESAHLGGAAYSVADIAVFPWIRNILTYIAPFQGKETDAALAEYPGLLRWYKAIAARPAVTQGIKKLEAEMGNKDMSAFQAATPDGIDRFLGRGKYARA